AWHRTKEIAEILQAEVIVFQCPKSFLPNRVSTPVENSRFCRLKIPQPWSSGGLQFRLVDGT
ncbi:MAG: hypothetical protein ACJ74Y_07845, partial [Bryobacteraceae bacterium]